MVGSVDSCLFGWLGWSVVGVLGRRFSFLQFPGRVDGRGEGYQKPDWGITTGKKRILRGNIRLVKAFWRWKRGSGNRRGAMGGRGRERVFIKMGGGGGKLRQALSRQMGWYGIHMGWMVWDRCYGSMKGRQVRTGTKEGRHKTGLGLTDRPFPLAATTTNCVCVCVSPGYVTWGMDEWMDAFPPHPSHRRLLAGIRIVPRGW